ncbi:MAG: hypothetical protein Q8L36_01155 [bacterium]|nr:hypothetical protein [bacterium]
MSLEDIKNRLYSAKDKKNQGTKEFISAESEKHSVQEKKPVELIRENWSTPLSENSGQKVITGQTKNSGNHFTFFVVGISVFALLFGGWLIYNHFRSSGVKISLELIVPDNVMIGAPFSVTVNIGNQSDTILQEAVLTLTPSGGLINLDTDASRIVLGNINSGDLTKRSFDFVVTSEEVVTEPQLEAILSYQLNSSSRFERKTEQSFLNLMPAIKTEIDSPGQVLGGSNFEIVVSYLNESNFNFSDLIFEAAWPEDFKFNSGRPAPADGNNLWRVGDLPAGSRGSFSFSGFVTSPPQSLFNFPIVVKTIVNGQEYKISEVSVNFSVAPSPLALETTINNSPNYIARLNDRLHYVVRYRNNSGIALVDGVIKIKLKGLVFNFASLQTEGDIDTVNNVLTWHAANTPGLKLLSPGAGGEVSFDIRLLPEFPIHRLSDKNFSLIAETTMDSPTVPYYFNAAKTSVSQKMETKVAGQTTIDSQGFYRDASSGLVNEGFLPPKVNQPTQYTIHWLIKNYATDVRNVVVRAILKSGVAWTGAVRSNIDSVPVFNERTNEIVWQIDKLAASKGLIGEAAEAIFQIEAVPNLTQFGQYQPLIGETSLKAVDEFTGLPLEFSDSALTTALPDDLTVGQIGGRVVQ